MITLYHSKDTRSLRCLWLLEELKLDYELSMVTFPPTLKQPDFLTVNPAGTVPYLVDGQTELSESCAILLYLAQTHAQGALTPAPDSMEYGRMLEWLFFGETSLAAPLATVLRYGFFLPEEMRNKAVVEDFQAQFQRRLGQLEQALQERSYLCGEQFCIADISVGYALLLGKIAGLGRLYSPVVAAYLQRLEQRPALIKARSLG